MDERNRSKEFSDNLHALRRCEKIYKYSVGINIFFLLMTTGATIVISAAFIVSGNDPFLLLLNGLIIHGIYAAAFLYGCYRKKDRYLFIMPVMLLTAIAVPTDTGLYLIDSGMLPFCVGISAACLWANRKYAWLEQQEGYPHFNELLEDEVIGKNSVNAFNSAIEERIKLLKENSSGDMDSLTLTGETIEAKTNEKNDFMDSV